MDPFEKALECAYGNHGNAEARREAEEYLQNVTKDPNAWILCLNKVNHSNQHIQFFAIHTLSLLLKNRSIPVESHPTLGQALLQLSPNILSSTTIRFLSLSLALLIHQDYPHQWQQPFPDIAQTFQSAPEIILLTLQELHPLLLLSIEFKDHLRVHQGPFLASYWSLLLSPPSSPSTPTLSPPLRALVLQNISLYVPFFDIALFISPSLLSPILLSFSDSSSPSVSAAAALALASIASKGMAPLPKATLLRDIDLIRYALASFSDPLLSSHVELLTSRARLIVVIWEELWGVFLPSRLEPENVQLASFTWSQITNIAGTVIDLAYQNKNYRVAKEAVDALAFGVSNLKPKEKTPAAFQIPEEHHVLFATKGMEIAFAMTAYPTHMFRRFDGSEDSENEMGDEEEEDFRTYRDSLLILFRRCFQNLRDGLEVIRVKFLSNLLGNLTEEKLEAGLNLICLTTESYSKNLMKLLQNENEIFTKIIFDILRKEEIYQFHQKKYRQTFYDFVLRFSAFFLVENRQIFLKKVLSIFFDSAGFAAKKKKTLEMTGVKFLKLIKNTNTVLTNIAPELVEAMQPFLDLGAGCPEEKVSVFEAVGVLIGCCGSVEKRVSLLEGVLSRLIGGWGGGGLVGGLRGMSALAKGCQGSGGREGWKRVLEVVVGRVRGGVKKGERGALVGLMHQVIGIVGEEALGMCGNILEVIYEGDDLSAVELGDLAVFLHHLTAHFGLISGEVIFERCFAKFFSKHYLLWNSIPEDSMQLLRERAEIQSPFFLFLHGLAVSSPGILAGFLTKEPYISNGCGFTLRSFMLAPFVRFATPMVTSVGSSQRFLLPANWAYVLGTFEKLFDWASSDREPLMALQSLDITGILDTIIGASAFFDTQDPQHLKLSGDICTLMAVSLIHKNIVTNFANQLSNLGNLLISLMEKHFGKSPFIPLLIQKLSVVPQSNQASQSEPRQNRDLYMKIVAKQ